MTTSDHVGNAVEPRFSLIIPAHNEEGRIGPTLDSFAPLFADSEIIVVLNGCADRTIAVVRNASLKFPNISIADIADAVGKGGAVRAGLALSRAPIVGYVDADGATPALEMRRLFEELGRDDALIASRWMPGAKVTSAQPLRRRIASRVFNTLVNTLFGLGLHDTQCGAKVFRASAIRSVASRVETSNLAFDVDLLYALRSNKQFSIRETPTVWCDQSGSQVKLARASAQMFASVVRLRLRHSIFRYAIPLFDRLWPIAGMQQVDGLKILLFNWRDVEHPNAGGAETYLHELGKRWVRNGHHVEWVTAGFPGGARVAGIDGMTIHRVGSAATVYFAAALFYLRSLRDRFDVIIDAENGIPFFTPFFSLKPKILLMHHVHTEVFRKHLPVPLSWLCIWLESWLMPRVYSGVPFVAVSESTKDEIIRQRMTKERIAVVHNGVDGSLRPGTKSLHPSICYVGRLKAYKRIDLLLRAVAKLREQIPDLRLVIGGAGDAERDLKILATTLGISESVSFEGFVSEERKQQILASAWIFATPSEIEGWGISVIEANACGTPSVGFDVPGIRESIASGVSGIVATGQDEFEEALRMLLSDRQRREALSIGALEWARKFSWDASADRMLELILRYSGSHQMTLTRVNNKWKIINRRNFSKQRAFSDAFDIPVKPG